MSTAKKAAPKKKGANGYKLPDPIPKGEILTDMRKQKWKIGTSIGVGGFGEIYCAVPAENGNKPLSEYPAVIKIEPHGNGPLFVEMHFYMRNANPADINKWKKEKNLATLGMPPFLGSGSHECNGTKYRFVVMERYGTDLWKLFLENGRRFPEHTVYKVAWQIINVLEYIHDRKYIHADIKGGNLLLDLKSQNNVYLVDFGLASHYTTKSEYKLDPKKAHNGTIEYTSRDAHMGVPTMRSDFEILFYNMVQWLCGTLPWEKNLSNPSLVQQQKNEAFDDNQTFLKKCFGSTKVPAPISQFMTLLANLEFNEYPNYKKFREILTQGLQKLNHSTTGKLEFSSKTSGRTVTASKKTKASVDTDDDDASKNTRSTPVRAASARSRATPSKSIPSKAISKTKTTLTKNSPRIDSVLANDSLNDSVDSVILDERCMSGRDMRRQLLENIDGDAEYVVQIKKRKTKTASKVVATAAATTPTRRGRKKVEKVKDDSSDSEPEVIIKGTRSRPAASKRTSAEAHTTRGKSSRLKNVSDRPNYDSDQDMFDESLDD
ncbi:serine/threonine-protein kinase VRK1 [Trichogramma pretiosum]|uniref:serine/threonine-protein kinase VRK1 n=1 Tax=Trichogramma pretiosum TaxID=7493 RepID=UPI0006C9A38A|nr:serine/threonine-protein kinase VRK1 [Trichogramma pretiosum]